MKNIFGTYFVLEYKKSIKVLGKAAVSMLIMIILTGAGLAAVSRVVFQSQMFQTIEVGVAIPEKEDTTKLVAQVISTMDSVKSVCRFHYLEGNEAMEKLKNGKIQALISLPDHFYKDVDSGRDTLAVVYFPEDTPFTVQVFQELVVDGVSLLRTAQAGVYAALDTADDQGAVMDRGGIGDFISYQYIRLAFDRNGVFEKKVISSLGEMDLYSYYVSAGIVLVLLMSGLNCGFLYQRQSRAAEQKLKIYGLGSFKISVVKVLVMANILWLLGSLLYLLGCLISALSQTNIMWFEWKTLMGLIPMCLGIAGYFHMIYSFSGNGMQGTVLLLALNTLMIVCSGVLIPIAYFPEVIGRIGSGMPLHFWHQYCASAVFGELGAGSILAAAAAAAAATGIGALAAWKNT